MSVAGILEEFCDESALAENQSHLFCRGKEIVGRVGGPRKWNKGSALDLPFRSTDSAVPHRRRNRATIRCNQRGSRTRKRAIWRDRPVQLQYRERDLQPESAPAPATRVKREVRPYGNDQVAPAALATSVARDSIQRCGGPQGFAPRCRGPHSVLLYQSGMNPPQDPTCSARPDCLATYHRSLPAPTQRPSVCRPTRAG